MEHVALAVIATIVLVVGGGVVASVRRHHGSVSAIEAPLATCSVVRVLTSDDELRDAVHRAARFEETVAHMLATRTRRYEAIVPTASITSINAPQVPPVGLPQDQAQHSA